MVFLQKEEEKEKEKLTKEYSLLRNELYDRSYKTWAISVVLIVGSVLVALAPITVAVPLPVLSIVLIALAFILHATSERVSTIGYNRLHELEDNLKISGAMRLFESEISEKWWYLLRRNIAYIVFIILIGTYVFMITPNIWLLTLAISPGLVLVLAKELVTNEKTKAKTEPPSDYAKEPEKVVSLPLAAEANAPIVMKCKNWEEFLTYAAPTRQVSVTLREPDNIFEADTQNGNQIVTYTGPVPALSLLLNEYLSKNLRKQR